MENISRLKKKLQNKKSKCESSGKNIDQESILILRYLTPPKPPPSKDGGGTIKTIDEALRHVSLIPFIDDWPYQGQTEVWCTCLEDPGKNTQFF